VEKAIAKFHKARTAAQDEIMREVDAYRIARRPLIRPPKVDEAAQFDPLFSSLDDFTKASLRLKQHKALGVDDDDEEAED
jgi:hypothetical protein